MFESTHPKAANARAIRVENAKRREREQARRNAEAINRVAKGKDK